MKRLTHVLRTLNPLRTWRGAERRRAVPSLEVLELRCTPSAVSLDYTFGNHGAIAFTSSFALYQEVRAVAIDVDGKLLVAATHMDEFGLSQFATSVYRFNDDGSLDTSFGTNGSVLLTGFHHPNTLRPDNFTADQLFIDGDGKILVVGSDIWVPLATLTNVYPRYRCQPERWD